MSVAVQCIDCTNNTSLPNLAFSEENSELKARYKKMRDAHRGHSDTFARPITESKSLLVDIYNECSERNWDGEGASPVNFRSLKEAFMFIENLPTSVSMPSDISVDNEGYISMEWRKRRGLIFDISFKGNNELIYAGILGTSKPRGLIYFGKSIPREIIEKIQVVGL